MAHPVDLVDLASLVGLVDLVDLASLANGAHCQTIAGCARFGRETGQKSRFHDKNVRIQARCLTQPGSGQNWPGESGGR